MPIEEYEVRVVQRDMRCDQCRTGYMRPTGMMLTSHPPQYPHRCDHCNTPQNYLVCYPWNEFVRGGLVERRSLQWSQSEGGAWVAGTRKTGEYLVAERIDNKGWNATVCFQDPGMADDECRSEQIILAATLEECKALCEQHWRGL